MTFWYGSGPGSPDPCLWLMDPDPAKYFSHWPSAPYFLKVHLHHFSKIKVIKKSLNSSNLVFSCNFCLMIEGSGSESLPLFNGSGSRSRSLKTNGSYGSGFGSATLKRIVMCYAPILFKLFKLWSEKRKAPQKRTSFFYKCVMEFNFSSIFGFGFSSYKKKVQIIVGDEDCLGGVL